ncbi:MAG: Iron-sulfur cluster assembly scaffold protein IscU [Syntrophomonadaceae bacterium]|nr:Iron-sulfur cluster assembly scaffold protein IscU [Bacillota bacterium]MBT9148129.1 Iron-sulfur cluster assembly scaffold protein IscU [Bacillota bacterium]
MTERKEGNHVYNDKVLDHFLHPRNIGVIGDASAIGNGGNPECGDVIRIYLKIKEDTIVDAKVKVFGCAVAIAAASIVTEMVRGKTIDEALSVKNDDISNALGGLPPQKLKCSVLAEAVLRDVICRYQGNYKCDETDEKRI